ncbi:MAG: FkbM family methyltransferase [Candidatus Dormibacteraceae bacterium]
MRSGVRSFIGAGRRLVTAGLARADLEVWARLDSGQRMRVGLGSTVGRSIWWRHTYETEIDQLVRRHLRPGDVFIDVGANVGYFSLVAAQLVGPLGEVHSFEPDPRAHALLARSVVKNHLNNVWCHRVALWGEETRLTLIGLDDLAFRYVAKSDPKRAELPAIAVRLDAYLEAIHVDKPIRLVKIDVEGAEVEVIRGMSEVLRTDRPLLVVEAHDSTLARFHRRIEDIFAALGEHGYVARDGAGHPVRDAAEARTVLAGSQAPNLVFQAE